jgi:hypothetical protein
MLAFVNLGMRICLKLEVKLLHLFEFISSCISSLFLSEIPFSNNQMVSTRSGEGPDIPSVVCAHIANQQKSSTTLTPQPSNGSSNATVPCHSDAANPKPDCHYSKHSSSAKSVTTSSTTSTSGQA